jgi:demethylmenaquinone methyltransferase / 2-methoxy-6-polyprenyl-1,4-benzoquinol methylase
VVTCVERCAFQRCGRVTDESTVRSAGQVRAMFGSIAWRYDRANHLLSCGFDLHWRKRAAEIVATWRPRKIIDVATGTGDLALAIQRKLPDSEVIGVDFADEMLAIARKKGVRRLITADALALPLVDRSFDCVTIAFGLRNIEDASAALREMARVLVRNGKLLVVEFSLPSMSILRSVYRLYLHRILPILGSFLTRKKSAYDYLGDSIEQFPGGEQLLRLIEANGFGEAKAEALTGGIVTIYSAMRT